MCEDYLKQTQTQEDEDQLIIDLIIDFWIKKEKNGTWDEFPKGYFPYCNIKDKNNEEF